MSARDTILELREQMSRSIVGQEHPATTTPVPERAA